MHRCHGPAARGADFLRLGASGVATAAGGDARRAARPSPRRHRPTPQGDDVGFLAFGAVARARRARLLPQGAGDARALRRRRAPAPDAGARRQARAHPSGSTRRWARTPSLRATTRSTCPRTRSPPATSAAGPGRRPREAARRRLPQRRRLRRPTRARACSSPGCSPSTARSSATLHDMAGKAVGRRPADAAEHRAGGRRPRQAPNRSRLARRAMTMRRTTLAIVLAVRRRARSRRPPPRRSTSTPPPR